MRPPQLAYVVALVVGCGGGLPAQRSPVATNAPYRAGIDVEDYALSLALPERGSIIRGDALLTVRRTARVDTLVLDLIALTVDSLLLDGRKASFEQTNGHVAVPLPAGASGRFRVEVAYRGAVQDGLIIRSDVAGRWTGFGDNWPNRARYWIPSVDDPSDKATVSWTVTAPASRTAGS